MEPQTKRRKRSHQPDEPSTSTTSVSASNDHMEHVIPNCHLIASNIFKYLSAKDILNLAKVSRNWCHPCREYLHQRRPRLQCCVFLDQVDGLEALNSLSQVLDAEILGHRHPFTGVHFKFKDPFEDFFKMRTAPYKRPQQAEPESDDPQYFNFEPENDSEVDDYDYEHHDYTQDYESLDAWICRQREEAQEMHQELAKVDRPLKRIFAKIPAIMKHVHMEVDYGAKREFQGEKFKRFFQLLPLHQIEYFRTNLRISEFIGDLRVGQLSNLKTLHIDGLMSALSSTLERLLNICPALENWDSPIPGNMVPLFGSKKHLIKHVVLYSFINQRQLTQIHEANLSLTTLIANAATCPIGKGSFDSIIDLMRKYGDTLEIIQVSDSFLKHILNSALSPMPNIRKILIGKSSKGTRAAALRKFPNAVSQPKSDRKFSVFFCKHLEIATTGIKFISKL